MLRIATSTLAALVATTVVAAPMAAVAAPAATYLSVEDPIGDAVVTGADKDDLSEYVYDGADINRADVDNDDNNNADVIFTFHLENLQEDATVGETELLVANTVKFLVRKANRKKGKKAVYETRSVDVAYTIADDEGEDEVTINGEPCFGTSAAITNNAFSHFTIRVPIDCFGSKPVVGSAAFTTRGTDYATGGVVRDSVRTGVYSLRRQS